MTDVHVASFIVRTRPEIAHEVAARVGQSPSTEIHAVDNGRIIVVVESADERALADRMDAIRNDPDVLIVSLVYHAVDQDTSPEPP